jgi:hypothetical protein
VSFIDIPDPTKTSGRRRLLFRYDPERRLVEAAGQDGPVIIDLAKYDPSADEILSRLRDFHTVDDGAVEAFTEGVKRLLGPLARTALQGVVADARANTKAGD